MRTDRTFQALVVLCVGLAVALVVGLGQRPDDDGGLTLTPTPDRPAPAVASAAQAPVPRSARARAELRTLDREGGVVLDGDVRERLERLRGAPVVVNVWAAWCPPCRAEFPAFAQVSRRYAGKVAFLGLDAQDDRGDATAFLREFPLPYPSLFDAKAGQARDIGAGRSWPTTVFFDARGRRVHVREGGYSTAAALEADVRTYALARPRAAGAPSVATASRTR